MCTWLIVKGLVEFSRYEIVFRHWRLQSLRTSMVRLWFNILKHQRCGWIVNKVGLLKTRNYHNSNLYFLNRNQKPEITKIVLYACFGRLSWLVWIMFPLGMTLGWKVVSPPGASILILQEMGSLGCFLGSLVKKDVKKSFFPKKLPSSSKFAKKKMSKWLPSLVEIHLHRVAKGSEILVAKSRTKIFLVA